MSPTPYGVAGTGVFIRTWAIDSPWGIAAASDGSVYVSTDFAIHKYSASGSYQYSWGSFGGLNGQFTFVQDVAVDRDGNVYAADLANHRIQKFTSTGVFLRVWGVRGAGAGLPIGVTVGGDGYVYETDSGNSTIQKFNLDGGFITAWALPDGIPGEGNRFGRTAVDEAGNAYVPDKFAHRVVIHDREGTVQASWGTYGSGPGQFETPTCASLDRNGHLYVMDYWNYRIQEYGYLPTAVAEGRAAPLVPVLDPPAPSPMTNGMHIRLAIPREGPAELLVFDIHGRVVAHLLEGRQRSGWRDLAWDGRGGSGRPVPSGVYFLRLNASHSVCRRFVVLR